ncbi:hypothetical protein OG413_42515 [Streptomyces sp. NBC_01433]|uniref:hypothetical protein n=1 Tax=Streptomyces sp. NBC_01433 TaxID=2903864 RepID=UPI0022508927|nr:hypothetical protein [Streptomyces sp. NBC_01433]MCX4681879.1 hypothetical protein [Streptomyces sp. NBC_01433]
MQALRSLYHACNAGQAAWRSALALVDGLSTQMETVEEYDRGRRFQHHVEAVNAARSGAYRYERELGLTAWRYASAHAVLGITVFDRLVTGTPALTASKVDELCEEPTLEQLRRALSIPVERLLSARKDPSHRKRTDEERQALITMLDCAHRDIRVVDAARPMTEREAWSCRLTDHSPLGTDPMYEGILEPLFNICEETPLEIDWRLRNAGADVSQ